VATNSDAAKARMAGRERRARALLLDDDLEDVGHHAAGVAQRVLLAEPEGHELLVFGIVKRRAQVAGCKHLALADLGRVLHEHPLAVVLHMRAARRREAARALRRFERLLLGLRVSDHLAFTCHTTSRRGQRGAALPVSRSKAMS
jgi:hypothetical protein